MDKVIDIALVKPIFFMSVWKGLDNLEIFFCYFIIDQNLKIFKLVFLCNSQFIILIGLKLFKLLQVFTIVLDKE